MDDLIAWLRACLGDEQDDVDGRINNIVLAGPLRGESLTYAEVAARPLFRRELAEIDAKRRIIDLHPYANMRSAPESCLTCAVVPGPCMTLRLLALPYADREGYRPEWRFGT